jgi:hypothetical protein
MLGIGFRDSGPGPRLAPLYVAAIRLPRAMTLRCQHAACDAAPQAETMIYYVSVPVVAYLGWQTIAQPRSPWAFLIPDFSQAPQPPQ